VGGAQPGAGADVAWHHVDCKAYVSEHPSPSTALCVPASTADCAAPAAAHSAAAAAAAAVAATAAVGEVAPQPRSVHTPLETLLQVGGRNGRGVCVAVPPAHSLWTRTGFHSHPQPSAGPPLKRSLRASRQNLSAPHQVQGLQNSLAAVNEAPGLGLSEAAELLQAEFKVDLVR
jgi:hypothetical protein